MLGFKSNKVQGVSSVSLAGRSADPRRHSRGSQSGSLHGFELLEVCKLSSTHKSLLWLFLLVCLSFCT